MTDKDGNNILLDDYYHEFLRKEAANRPRKRPLKRPIIHNPVQVILSESESGDMICYQSALAKPVEQTSSTWSIGSYESSVRSHYASDEGSTGKSCTTDYTLTGPEKRQPPPIPTTRPPYRAGGRLAQLAAARAAGKTFPTKESLNEVPMGPVAMHETPRKDSSGSTTSGSSAAIDPKKGMTPPPVPNRPSYRAGGRLAQLAADREERASKEALNKVASNLSTTGESSTTLGGERDYCESTTSGPAPSSAGSEGQATPSPGKEQCVGVLTREDAPEADEDCKAQDIKFKSSRKVNVPKGAVGRYLAGPEASREDIIQLSPEAANSLLEKGPKELRVLGLTLGDIFLDPHTGKFTGPDRSIGETNALRKKYEHIARKQYENGELKMRSPDGEDKRSLR